MVAIVALLAMVPNDGLAGKVLCGYQGWFTTPGDGTGIDWFHYANRGKFEPGHSNVEYWPDTRELGADEKIPTAFKHKDGSTAYVYSAANATTVKRHFRWMKDYGIDGVFVQRFGSDLRGAQMHEFRDKVLQSCREGAESNGRLFAVMYDLSGLNEGETASIREDWMKIRGLVKSPQYLRDHGKPVVAVWGVGFNDRRRYTLKECEALVDFLQKDGAEVMLGVPTYWREGNRDSLPDIQSTVAKADIISPWAVGRFGDDEGVRNYGETVKADIAWCDSKGKQYMPVAFPGFSWHNMNPGSKFDQIPRRAGAFMRSQFDAYRAAGAKTAYVAMFDEMDEGTAIFKVAPDAPEGFLTYGDLPSDYYLRLVGDETKKMRR